MNRVRKANLEELIFEIQNLRSNMNRVREANLEELIFVENLLLAFDRTCCHTFNDILLQETIYNNDRNDN